MTVPSSAFVLSAPVFNSTHSSWANGRQSTPTSSLPATASRSLSRSTISMVSLTRDSPHGQVKRVVVTGTGVASCFGSDSDVFYQSLLEGKSGVKKITSFDTSGWSTNFAATVDMEQIEATKYVNRKLLRRLDPFITYAIVAGKKALENAGIPVGSEAFNNIDKSKIGCLCGTGVAGHSAMQAGIDKLVNSGYKKISPFFIPYTISNMAAAMVGIECDLKGPNYCIATACAAGNYSINHAALHIRRGECDICLAGGSDSATNPSGIGGFIACHALSSNNENCEQASRPLDKNRDGFVMGEGSGFVVMESLESALARGAPILAEYIGGAQTFDAYHMTEPRPDGLGVRNCITNALADAGVSKDRVNYINAHATSTMLGDLAEFRAIRSVFDGDVSKIRMNCTKSMIGHGLGAASGFEAVVTVKALQTGKIHPTINVTDIEPEVDIDIVRDEMQEHDIDVAISNSFGFGGHNSTTVFTKYVE